MPEPASGHTQHADQLLDSTLESVDVGEALVLRTARDLGMDEDTQHRVGISVREALVNAVAHGNRYNVRKKVHFVVESDPETLTIRIEDEGDGFHEASVPDPTDAANIMRHSGRGLLMMRAFMDVVDYQPRVPTGTSVRMVKSLRPAEAGA
ncbi:MAG: ATP-binding protein [Acidobacteria bacterium]|nr:ATP-binding protein [Acidobacteriota bacterium]